MTTETPDLTLIASEGEPITLSTGTKVTVERLKTRQTMRLMKILTRGAGAALTDLDFGGADASVAILGAVIFAIPEAEDETIDFVRSMVTPYGLIEDPRTKPEIEVNEGLFERLALELENPELDDLVSILERVITVEAPHLTALGKRLALLTKTFQQSEQAKAPAKAKRSVSSASTSKASTRTAS